MDWRRTCGGILKLRELIEEHPAEFAYDFRSRFGLSYQDIGDKVSYLEAILLVSILLKDTSSWLQSVLSGWDYPVSREWIVAAHSYDLQALAHSGRGKKPKPYPNPFPSKERIRVGKTNLTNAEVRALLAKMNPKEH